MKIAKKCASILLLAMVSGAFALGLTVLLGAHNARIGFLDMRISLTLTKHGRTDLVLRPFGEITAATHRAPLRVSLSVEQIRGEFFKEFLEKRIDYRDQLATMKEQAAPLLKHFVLRLLALALVGGMIGGIVGRPLRFWNLFGGAACGLLTVAALLLATYRQYDVNAFRSPRFIGLLTYAPKLVTYVQRSAKKGRDLQENIRGVTANLTRFYAELDQMTTPAGAGRGRVTILHVSDMHNNPLAADLVRTLARELSPDLILDTGDITDAGTPLELTLMDGLKNLKPPHIFVSGNHDSPEVVASLKKDYGFLVLDGDLITARRLRILGYGDPAAKEGGPFNVEPDPKGLDALAETIRARLAKMRTPPDILMAHNPKVADRFAGGVSLILCGHTHDPNVREVKGSVIVNAGTTGAAGARYFYPGKKPLYSAALISIRFEQKPVVEYVDFIRLDQLGGEFSLQRKSFSSGAPPPNAVNF